MSRQNAFGFDLTDAQRRGTLKPRFPPYWQVTEYGRAVGYQKHPSGQSYWVARMRLTDETYRQQRLGLSEDGLDSLEGFDFATARRAAETWFATAPCRSSATQPRPVGSTEHLNACPTGDVYTIGHALSELVEWKRLVAARSHFLTVVTLTNYYFVPRLFSLPASAMTPERLRILVKEVLETPPKRGNQAVPARRPIEHMSEDELRRRKRTVNTLIGILRMALVMAWENGRIDTDRPWRCLRRLNNVDRPRILHLSRSECFQLLEHCGPDMRDLVLGALYTGCRITELLRMQAKHVGRDGFGVYITPVKTYRSRVVLLPEEGLEFFKRMAAGKKPDDFLFLRRDGRGWFTNYRHVFKRAVSDSGLPAEFCFHSLRHTYASQLVGSGTPIIVVSEQLGHRNIETVSRTYGHLSPDIRLAEVRKRFASLHPADLNVRP